MRGSKSSQGRRLSVSRVSPSQPKVSVPRTGSRVTVLHEPLPRLPRASRLAAVAAAVLALAALAGGVAGLVCTLADRPALLADVRP